MTLTNTIVNWAKDRNVKLERIPTDADAIQNLLSEIDNGIEDLCQSGLMKTYIENCGGYSECKNVQIWKAIYNHKIVGLMMMSTKFNLKARGWPEGYRPQHVNFMGQHHDISDLLLICSKHGPPGLGQLLTLLALSLSGEHGLFLQVQVAFVQMEIAENQLEASDRIISDEFTNYMNESFLVVRPLVLESAKHIYTKMHFEPIHVHNEQNVPLGIVCYYRNTPLTENELRNYLDMLDYKFSSRAARSEQIEFQHVQENLEEKTMDNLQHDPYLYEKLTSPQPDYSGELPYDPENGVAVMHPQTPQQYFNNDFLDAADPLAGQNMIFSGVDNGQPPQLVSEDITFSPIPYAFGPPSPQLVFSDNESESSQSPKRKAGRPRRTAEENTCKICNKTFKRGTALRRHMVKHNPTEKKLKCEKCEYKTNRTDDMKKHMTRKHADAKLLNCEICHKYETATKSDLQRHMKAKHKHSRKD
jgi:hypothetical protein